MEGINERISNLKTDNQRIMESEMLLEIKRNILEDINNKKKMVEVYYQTQHQLTIKDTPLVDKEQAAYFGQLDLNESILIDENNQVIPTTTNMVLI